MRKIEDLCFDCPTIAKPRTVVGNALTTRQKNEAIIQAIKNNYI